MKKKIGNRRKIAFLIGVGVFLIPILLNLLVFSWRLDTELPLLSVFNTHGSIEGWLSFWGNLVGTIVSGCVAFLVAKITISEQSKKDEKLEADLLTIKQLPALIKVKIELDKILGELLRISGEKKEIIEEYRENRVVFTESDLIMSLDYSMDCQQ
ncbi:hypothetical protein [Paenibacillus algicola]|uniref:hypothetical protein n=1 Tax=Paenibacillus algicola TaxID=2565926 RepID=UPI0010FE388E|nr:hypothetical protein [Paenibacillus algicola]